MNRLKNFFFISLVLFLGTSPKVLVASESEQAGGPLSVSEVNKKVCDFPNGREKPSRPKVENPGSYLKPFVGFLKTHGEEPKAFVMKALAKHKVVIIGEIHHRPRYWAFNSSLVTEPDFPKLVGTIYMELPSNDQELVDKFLAAEDCNTMPVIEMLRDNLWMGWPDQAMLDFFITVWMVNQDLEPKQKLRIVLADMQRPWKEIQERGNWQKYEAISRDRQMADNILADIREHADEKRNTLFIVGVDHTALNLKFFEGSSVTTAGWYLRGELGADKVYTIFQHRPVQTNQGRVDGRLCLGLFDSAFAAIGNKPIAFPLEKGPFGEQPYDADPETPVSSTYKDGFNSYLCLGPLETEIFSPLIAGFYTNEFVKELDRRYRMTFGKGWAENYKRDEMNAETFIAWMSNGWGKPRREWQRNILGPMDAWKYGDNWKEKIRKANYATAFEHPEVITNAATELFNAIRNADYEHYSNGSDWQHFLPQGLDYQVNHYFDEWVRWVCKTFKNNPIQSVELGKVFKGPSDRPVIPYKLTLKDGTILEGNLPFDYNPQLQVWYGVEGIDWHLQSKKP
jgi:hypothetical protein